MQSTKTHMGVNCTCTEIFWSVQCVSVSQDRSLIQISCQVHKEFFSNSSSRIFWDTQTRFLINEASFGHPFLLRNVQIVLALAFSLFLLQKLKYFSKSFLDFYKSGFKQFERYIPFINCRSFQCSFVVQSFTKPMSRLACMIFLYWVALLSSVKKRH